MSFKNSPKNMVAVKNKLLTCSTPENRSESPSRDSDSLYDSDAASPVPFLCTQDGAEGETDVVWNFYTPKSDHTASRAKNSTPLTRKARKSIKPKIIEKPLPKRRPLRNSQKKTELFQELLELNQNLHELIPKKSQKRISSDKRQSGSEEDIFNESGEFSPKSGLRSNNNRCLRRNLLSSKFGKPEPETALDSDDSMNECLLKASQIVEEKILSIEPACKKSRMEFKNVKKPFIDNNYKMDQDSMDAIISSITLDSPMISKIKRIDSPRQNDSFDSIVGGLNDSAFEQLTQAPIKANHNWTVKDVKVHGSPVPFSRYNSMPESPSYPNVNRPSTSGTVFGRYNSVPLENNTSQDSGDSPIRCTPDEIKKKHQLAREKLLAKRLLPFTITQQNTSKTINTLKETIIKPKAKFQPKVPTNSNSIPKTNIQNSNHSINNGPHTDSAVEIKTLIEKKRQEALMKLRKRQPHSKKI